jgi:hypothetical protein
MDVMEVVQGRVQLRAFDPSFSPSRVLILYLVFPDGIHIFIPVICELPFKREFALTNYRNQNFSL